MINLKIWKFENLKMINLKIWKFENLKMINLKIWKFGNLEIKKVTGIKCQVSAEDLKILILNL